MRSAASLYGLILGTVLALGGPPSHAAETATATTSVIDQARELSRSTRKWTDRTQKLKLRIVDSRGGERNRELVIRMKKYPEDRAKSVVFFQYPPDVKGVGMLQWTDPQGKDEQWLYLPELRKVRQISGAAKRESFVGTDFSYEDLAIVTQILDWTSSEARSAALRDEERDGQNFHVVEFVPTGKEVSYAKILIWLRAADLVILRYEMLDASGQPVKLLTLSDVRQIGAIPTAFHMEMRTQQSGSQTIVDFSEVSYDTGLPDDAFSQRALEHGL